METESTKTAEEIEAELKAFEAAVATRVASVIVQYKSTQRSGQVWADGTFRVGVLPEIVVGSNRKDMEIVGEKLARTLTGEEVWTRYADPNDWTAHVLGRALLTLAKDAKVPVVFDLGTI